MPRSCIMRASPSRVGSNASAAPKATPLTSAPKRQLQPYAREHGTQGRNTARGQTRIPSAPSLHRHPICTPFPRTIPDQLITMINPPRQLHGAVASRQPPPSGLCRSGSLSLLGFHRACIQPANCRPVRLVSGCIWFPHEPPRF